MTVNNLSQLKKALAAGHDFQIVEHFVKPEMSGQIRRVNVMQTNGIYTHAVGNVSTDDAVRINSWNYGKGSWIEFGSAHDWTFASGLCQQRNKITGRPVWTIRLI